MKYREQKQISGVRIVPSSIKGLRSFDTPELREKAPRNIEYVELIKEYDTYYLVRIQTSVELKTIKNTSREKYFSYVESLMKADNQDIQFEI